MNARTSLAISKRLGKLASRVDGLMTELQQLVLWSSTDTSVVSRRNYKRGAIDQMQKIEAEMSKGFDSIRRTMK